jgi:hypothetical protein
MFEKIIWSVVSLTPPTSGQRCQGRRPPLVNGVTDTAHQRATVSLTPLTIKSAISKSIF